MTEEDLLDDVASAIKRSNKQAVRLLTDRLEGEVKTRNNKMIYLMHLAKNGIVGYACTNSGVSRPTIGRWRASDKLFDRLCDEAIEISIEALEMEARRRAVDGTDKPVFYQGMRCGTVREFSDSLLTLLLKAHRPEKYREKHDPKQSATDGSDGVMVYVPENGRLVGSLAPLATAEAKPADSQPSAVATEVKPDEDDASLSNAVDMPDAPDGGDEE